MTVALRRIIYTLSLYEFDSVGSYVYTRRFAIILVLVAVKLTLLFHATKYIPVHLQNMIIYIEVLSTIHTPIISWFERVTHSDSSRPSTRSLVIRNTFQARYQKSPVAHVLSFVTRCQVRQVLIVLQIHPFDRTMSICVHKGVVSFHGRT